MRMRAYEKKKQTKPTPAQLVFLQDFSIHAVTGNLQDHFTALQHLPCACPPHSISMLQGHCGSLGWDFKGPQQPPRNTLQTLFLRLGLTLRSGRSFHQFCPTADSGLSTVVTAWNPLQSINIGDWEKGLVQTDRLPWHRFCGIHSGSLPHCGPSPIQRALWFLFLWLLKKGCTPSFLRRQLTHFKISF